MSEIVSRKFCKFVATSQQPGQPPEAAIGRVVHADQAGQCCSVLQTRPQLLQLGSVVAMRDELLHRS